MILLMRPEREPYTIGLLAGQTPSSMYHLDTQNVSPLGSAEYPIGTVWKGRDKLERTPTVLSPVADFRIGIGIVKGLDDEPPGGMNSLVEVVYDVPNNEFELGFGPIQNTSSVGGAGTPGAPGSTNLIIAVAGAPIAAPAAGTEFIFQKEVWTTIHHNVLHGVTLVTEVRTHARITLLSASNESIIGSQEYYYVQRSPNNTYIFAGPWVVMNYYHLEFDPFPGSFGGAGALSGGSDVAFFGNSRIDYVNEEVPYTFRCRGVYAHQYQCPLDMWYRASPTPPYPTPTILNLATFQSRKNPGSSSWALQGGSVDDFVSFTAVYQGAMQPQTLWVNTGYSPVNLAKLNGVPLPLHQHSFSDPAVIVSEYRGTDVPSNSFTITTGNEA